MKPIDQVCFCVVDNGQFVSVARKLGEQSKKCYYWTPDENSFPLIQESVLGDGYPEIVRANSIWEIKSEVDCFVFCDIGMAGLQAELKAQGFPVWGAGDLDKLETHRGLFCDTLKSLGMACPKYEVVTGITSLREWLRDKTNKYIKVSKFRGNFETIHWISFAESDSKLDTYAIEFGPLKELVNFYVFDPVETEIEDGIDAYCIDGKFPKLVLHGFENKDKSYAGCLTLWEDLPEETRSVNERFAPALKDYRAFFSTEVRITDADSYFIDATCRCGSPPHQLMTEMFANFSDIIWAGANGVLVEPVTVAKFGVQALLTVSRSLPKEWVSVVVPDSLDRWVKLGFSCKVGGRIAIPPNPLENMAGYLVAIGDTLAEAIANLKSQVAELPDGLKCEDSSLAEVLREIKTAEEHGLEFTKQEIPEPASVVD